MASSYFDNYRRGGSVFDAIPPVTKNLLIINILMLFATWVLGNRGVDLGYYLALWPVGDFTYYGFNTFQPWQLVTYMFMHGGILHLFCNMFNLFMFGILLERALGSRRYLIYYMVCGIGAGLVQLAVMWFFGQPAPVIGASGAVFGILLAFGMLFPNMKLFIIPIPVPVKAKWLVLGYGLFEFFCGVTGHMGDVAHFAHLGGMLFGFFLILYWKRKGVVNNGGYGYMG